MREAVLLTLAATLAATAPLPAQRPVGAADNVVLITIDGARVQEMFGGLDLDILRSTLKKGRRPKTSRSTGASGRTPRRRGARS